MNAFAKLAKTFTRLIISFPIISDNILYLLFYNIHSSSFIFLYRWTRGRWNLRCVNTALRNAKQWNRTTCWHRPIDGANLHEAIPRYQTTRKIHVKRVCWLEDFTCTRTSLPNATRVKSTPGDTWVAQRTKRWKWSKKWFNVKKQRTHWLWTCFTYKKREDIYINRRTSIIADLGDLKNDKQLGTSFKKKCLFFVCTKKAKLLQHETNI